MSAMPSIVALSHRARWRFEAVGILIVLAAALLGPQHASAAEVRVTVESLTPASDGVISIPTGTWTDADDVVLSSFPRTSPPFVRVGREEDCVASQRPGALGFALPLTAASWWRSRSLRIVGSLFGTTVLVCGSRIAGHMRVDFGGNVTVVNADFHAAVSNITVNGLSTGSAFVGRNVRVAGGGVYVLGPSSSVRISLTHVSTGPETAILAGETVHQLPVLISPISFLNGRFVTDSLGGSSRVEITDSIVDMSHTASGVSISGYIPTPPCTTAGSAQLPEILLDHVHVVNNRSTSLPVLASDGADAAAIAVDSPSGLFTVRSVTVTRVRIDLGFETVSPGRTFAGLLYDVRLLPLATFAVTSSTFRLQSPGLSTATAGRVVAVSVSTDPRSLGCTTVAAQPSFVVDSTDLLLKASDRITAVAVDVRVATSSRVSMQAGLSLSNLLIDRSVIAQADVDREPADLVALSCAVCTRQITAAGLNLTHRQSTTSDARLAFMTLLAGCASAVTVTNSAFAAMPAESNATGASSIAAFGAVWALVDRRVCASTSDINVTVEASAISAAGLSAMYRSEAASAAHHLILRSIQATCQLISFAPDSSTRTVAVRSIDMSDNDVALDGRCTVAAFLNGGFDGATARVVVTAPKLFELRSLRNTLTSSNTPTFDMLTSRAVAHMLFASFASAVPRFSATVEHCDVAIDAFSRCDATVTSRTAVCIPMEEVGFLLAGPEAVLPATQSVFAITNNTFTVTYASGSAARNAAAWASRSAAALPFAAVRFASFNATGVAIANNVLHARVPAQTVVGFAVGITSEKTDRTVNIDQNRVSVEAWGAAVPVEATARMPASGPSSTAVLLMSNTFELWCERGLIQKCTGLVVALNTANQMAVVSFSVRRTTMSVRAAVDGSQPVAVVGAYTEFRQGHSNASVLIGDRSTISVHTANLSHAMVAWLCRGSAALVVSEASINVTGVGTDVSGSSRAASAAVAVDGNSAGSLFLTGSSAVSVVAPPAATTAAVCFGGGGGTLVSESVTLESQGNSALGVVRQCGELTSATAGMPVVEPETSGGAILPLDIRLAGPEVLVLLRGHVRATCIDASSTWMSGTTPPGTSDTMLLAVTEVSLTGGVRVRTDALHSTAPIVGPMLLSVVRLVEVAPMSAGSAVQVRGMSIGAAAVAPSNYSVLEWTPPRTIFASRMTVSVAVGCNRLWPSGTALNNGEQLRFVDAGFLRAGFALQLERCTETESISQTRSVSTSWSRTTTIGTPTIPPPRTPSDSYSLVPTATTTRSTTRSAATASASQQLTPTFGNFTMTPSASLPRTRSVTAKVATPLCIFDAFLVSIEPPSALAGVSLVDGAPLIDAAAFADSVRVRIAPRVPESKLAAAKAAGTLEYQQFQAGFAVTVFSVTDAGARVSPAPSRGLAALWGSIARLSVDGNGTAIMDLQGGVEIVDRERVAITFSPGAFKCIPVESTQPVQPEGLGVVDGAPVDATTTPESFALAVQPAPIPALEAAKELAATAASAAIGAAAVSGSGLAAADAQALASLTFVRCGSPSTRATGQKMRFLLNLFALDAATSGEFEGMILGNVFLLVVVLLLQLVTAGIVLLVHRKLTSQRPHLASWVGARAICRIPALAIALMQFQLQGNALFSFAMTFDGSVSAISLLGLLVVIGGPIAVAMLYRRVGSATFLAGDKTLLFKPYSETYDLVPGLASSKRMRLVWAWIGPFGRWTPPELAKQFVMPIRDFKPVWLHQFMAGRSIQAVAFALIAALPVASGGLCTAQHIVLAIIVLSFSIASNIARPYRSRLLPFLDAASAVAVSVALIASAVLAAPGQELNVGALAVLSIAAIAVACVALARAVLDVFVRVIELLYLADDRTVVPYLESMAEELATLQLASGGGKERGGDIGGGSQQDRRARMVLPMTPGDELLLPVAVSGGSSPAAAA